MVATGAVGMRSTFWVEGIGFGFFYPWFTAGLYFFGWPRYFFDIGMMLFIVGLLMYVLVQGTLAILYMYGSDEPTTPRILNERDILNFIGEQPHDAWHSAGTLPGPGGEWRA